MMVDKCQVFAFLVKFRRFCTHKCIVLQQIKAVVALLLQPHHTKLKADKLFIRYRIHQNQSAMTY